MDGRPITAEAMLCFQIPPAKCGPSLDFKNGEC